MIEFSEYLLADNTQSCKSVKYKQKFLHSKPISKHSLDSLFVFKEDQYHLSAFFCFAYYINTY